MGVLSALYNINNIIKKSLIGMEAFDQKSIDYKMIELDGTKNKSRLGANAILGVSMANLRASSNEMGVFLYKYISDFKNLPILMMNIINGGVHAFSKLSIQEFMIVPNRETVSERVRMGSEIFHSLKTILNEKGLSTNVGDEGGFAPCIDNTFEALDLIILAIDRAGYKPYTDVNLALDVAASALYHDGYYLLDGNKYSTLELIDYYENLCIKYPIISIEDGFEENDWMGFKLFTEKMGDKIYIVGDDLFVTNIDHLKKGIDMGCCNAIIIKPNQIGTISETLEVIDYAKKNGYKTIISHRSGETEDTIICDLAVGLNLDYIKAGSLSRTDRICKYNQLIRIEENIKASH